MQVPHEEPGITAMRVLTFLCAHMASSKDGLPVPGHLLSQGRAALCGPAPHSAHVLCCVHPRHCQAAAVSHTR